MNTNRIMHWLKQHWLATALMLFLFIPGAGFILLSAGLLIYTYLPVDYTRLETPPLSRDARHLVVLAHGLGDTPASWSAPLATTMAQQWREHETANQAIALDWHRYSTSSLRCAVNGRRIGQWLGARLSELPALESVHLIGHSCGAFVVYGVCEALRKKQRPIQVQSTYLDPVSIYNGLAWNFGVKHFGDCADFSDAYIDHEDGVPGSNELLPHTHTFDVTAARHTLGVSYAPHVWPTWYYRRLVASDAHPRLHLAPNIAHELPQGVLQHVTTPP